MANLLVTAAWEPELERFRALGVESLFLSLPTVTVTAIGIGLVDATFGLTRCIAIHAPTHVLLLGTAGGAPGSGLAIGDVIAGTAVRLVDAAIVEGRAAPVGPAEGVSLDATMRAAFVGAGARPASIMNTIGVTTDDELARSLASCGEVEHLEAFGVARTCQAHAVPCAIVLGIANTVGAGGREQWRSNHVAVSKRTAELAAAGVARWLETKDA